MTAEVSAWLLVHGRRGRPGVRRFRLLDGRPGSGGDVPPDTSLAGTCSWRHDGQLDFTVELIDNGLNQDSCEGQLDTVDLQRQLSK